MAIVCKLFVLHKAIKSRTDLDNTLTFWNRNLRGMPWNIVTYWFPTRKNMVDRSDFQSSTNQKAEIVLRNVPFPEDFLLVKQGYEGTVPKDYFDIELAYWDGVDKSLRALKKIEAKL